MRKERNGENYIMRNLIICTAHPIYGPQTNEGIGEWRRLHSEELSDLYCCLICTAV
jgi:hypothetical protein